MCELSCSLQFALSELTAKLNDALNQVNGLAGERSLWQSRAEAAVRCRAFVIT